MMHLVSRRAAVLGARAAARCVGRPTTALAMRSSSAHTAAAVGRDGTSNAAAAAAAAAAFSALAVVGAAAGLAPPPVAECAACGWFDKAGAAGPRPLVGEVVIVTGASGGIGAAIARQLAAAGASVCLAARRADRVETLAAELARTYDVPTLAVATDVTDRAAVKRCVAKTETALGPVSVLVSNAGVMHYTLMKNLHEDEWAQAVDVNCKGMLHGIGAVLPGMLARERGHILTISSDAGRKVKMSLKDFEINHHWVALPPFLLPPTPAAFPVVE